MGALTPSNKFQLAGATGPLDAVLAEFSSITDGDTWATGLGSVKAVFATPSDGSTTIGATYSSGTVTFSVASGPATTVKVLALGYA